MAMSRALMAIRGQADAWIQSYKSHLTTNGFGFTDDDLALIAAERDAHPVPEGTVPGAEPSAELQASAMGVARQALAAEYPEQGFAGDDPRLAPIEGIALVAYAVAANAMGWSTDPTLKQRVLQALGHTVGQWDAAVPQWTQRITDDITVAYLYGQLFSQVGELPRRPPSG